MGESFYFSNYLKCHSPHVQNQENFQCQTPSFVVLRLCMSIPSMKTIFREHYLGCKAKYLKKKKIIFLIVLLTLILSLCLCTECSE